MKLSHIRKPVQKKSLILENKNFRFFIFFIEALKFLFSVQKRGSYFRPRHEKMNLPPLALTFSQNLKILTS